MFLRERFILIGIVIALSLELFTGCESCNCRKPAPAAAEASPAVAPTKKVQLPADSGDNLAPGILEWDATEMTYQAQPGELKAPFTFNLTNVSSAPLLIYDTSTTCECTVAKLPSKPWTIPSGGVGKIDATIDLHNKSGTVTYSIIVFTSRGNRRLNLKAILPEQNSHS